MFPFFLLFLLSFLCFIKGNTKGKLCYLLKNVKVHFKREEKKQTHYCLDRKGNTLTLTGQPERSPAGTQCKRTLSWPPGSFPGPSWPRMHRNISRRSWRTRCLGAFWGEREHPKSAAPKEGKSGDVRARFFHQHDKDSPGHGGDSSRLTRHHLKYCTFCIL